MLPDCIDPEAHGLLEVMMVSSATDLVFSYSADFYTMFEDPRLHWNSCPACRYEFPDAPAVFDRIGVELENRAGALLAALKDEYLGRKLSLSAGTSGVPSSYPELIAWLVDVYIDVHTILMDGQQLLNHRVSAPSKADFGDLWDVDEPLLSLCQGFIGSLEPDVQNFVVAATLSFNLLNPMYERLTSGKTYMLSDSGEEIVSSESDDDTRRRFEAAIANSELGPDVFFQTIELAALGYTNSHFDNSKVTHASTVLQVGLQDSALVPRETAPLPNVLQELKQDFDNALDSLKAGQMETMRLIEHNQRPAAAYEPDIEARLGELLYSRLGETTRLGLQVAEYLYHINGQEPNYFHGPVMQMALAYENELAVRVIWPFVSELQNAGNDAYDGQGVSREPLLSEGKVPRNCMMLGNLARYLRLDGFMRGKLSALSFDVDAIAKDAMSIASVRNRAAHAPICERSVADELRQRMLCQDSVFNRLHPKVAIAPSTN